MIESIKAEPLRKERKWSEVYKMIPELEPYKGINEILKALNQKGIPIAIVTSSPGSYCKSIIEHQKWDINFTVCYHDTRNRKPHPEPIMLAISKMKIPTSEVVAIGDDAKDIIAARKAEVCSVAALWGSIDKVSLVRANPDYVCKTVSDLKDFLYNKYLFF